MLADFTILLLAKLRYVTVTVCPVFWKNVMLLSGGYVKSIVTLGWSIWTCNSKSLQVYADQGSLLGSQEEAADLASRLTDAERREAVLKAALSDEQASHQSDARLAAARDSKASADLQAIVEKVSLPLLGSC